MPPLSTHKFNVLVVGGGPAGLIAAAALAQEGHQVTVLERQPDLRTQGGMLIIQPAAVRALCHIGGAAEALGQIAVPGDKFYWWSHGDDRPFASMATPPISEIDRVQTDRPALQRVGYNLAVDAGVFVLFGKKVVRVDDQKSAVWTEDGEEFQADMILGVDGIKSTIRRLIFPDKDVEPIPTRECIFHADVSIPSLVTDPLVADFLEPGALHATLGPGKFAIGRQTTHNSFGMLCIDIDHGPPGPVNGAWNTPGDVGLLRERFSKFNRPFRAFLGHVTECSKWQIANAAELETWRSPSGRVLLIGDAAHAMVPHAAQGVSQGIEDGIAIARLLRWARRPDDIPFISESFETLRRPRVDRFVKQSLENAAKHSLDDGPEQKARDEGIREMSKRRITVDWKSIQPDKNANPPSPAFMIWMAGYNVMAEVDRFMEGNIQVVKYMHKIQESVY